MPRRPCFSSSIPLIATLAVAALLGCNSRRSDQPSSDTATASTAVETPTSCPPGNAVEDGRCILVVTPAQVQSVAQQRSRLDDLVEILDKVETLSAPIELLGGLRQQEAWKQLAATSSKLAAADDVVRALAEAVVELRAFKATVKDAAARLGNLEAELDRMLARTGAARQLSDLRKDVSAQLAAVLQPLQARITAFIQRVVDPVVAQLNDAADLVAGACAAAKLSGSSDKLRATCAEARVVFGKAIAYLEDLKAKPAQLYLELTSQLEAQLDKLIDDGLKSVLANAQSTVNEALRLPPRGLAASGPGSSP